MLCTGALGALAVFLCSGSAHAYVDPGTGSYILQIVIAGLVGAAFTLRIFWKRLKIFMSCVFSKKKDRRGEGPSTNNE